MSTPAALRCVGTSHIDEGVSAVSHTDVGVSKVAHTRGLAERALCEVLQHTAALCEVPAAVCQPPESACPLPCSTSALVHDSAMLVTLQEGGGRLLDALGASVSCASSCASSWPSPLPCLPAPWAREGLEKDDVDERKEEEKERKEEEGTKEERREKRFEHHNMPGPGACATAASSRPYLAPAASASSTALHITAGEQAFEGRGRAAKEGQVQSKCPTHQCRCLTHQSKCPTHQSRCLTHQMPHKVNASQTTDM